MLGRRLREIEEQRRSRIAPYRAGAAACLERALLLDRLIETALARDDRAAAAAHAEALATLGAEADCAPIAARGERGRGAVLLAGGDAAAAVPCLERALAAFTRLELPFEAARTRLLLARALAGADGEAAVAEARAALGAAETLGAERLADQAAALLRSLGVRAARSGPRGARGAAVLTRREQEVLALLAEGLSNRELAERLVVTRKTVEHHVASILAKLDLANRAEAAAYAVRHQD